MRGLTLDEIFVPTPLFEDSEERFYSNVDSNIKRSKKELLIKDILEDKKNYLINGKGEVGKTTLLYHLISSVLEFPQNYEFNIPCLINYNNINPKNKNSIIKEIRRFYLSVSHETVASFLRNGKCLILIDDVNFQDTHKLKALQNFIKDSNNFKCILTSDPGISEAIDFEEKDLGFNKKFEVIHLHSFRKKEIGLLVENWYYGSDKNKSEKDDIKSQLINILLLTQIPRTPINICFLLWILETSNNAKGIINRPALIEEFVEIVLEKFPQLQGIRNSPFEKIDYRTKQHYLAHLAGEMVMGEKFKYEYQELVDKTSNFFKNIGNKKIDIRKFIDYLIDKGILSEKRNEYSFKFKCVGEYFIANQMIESQKFYNHILEECRYLSYTTEIDYLTGLKRNNLEILNLLQKRVKKYFKEQKQFNQIILDNFIEIESKGELFNNSDILLSTLSHNKKKRIEELEDETYGEPLQIGNSENNQDISKSNNHEELEIKSFEALRLLSIVLKNCEFVSPNIKSEMMDFIMNCWSIITMAIMEITEGVLKKNSLEEIAKKYSKSKRTEKEFENLSKEEIEEIKELVKVSTPLILQKIIKDSLGSDKIEDLLKVQVESSKPIITKLISTFLYVDLSFPQFPSLLRRVYQDNKKTKYLSKLFYSKAITKILTSSDLSEKNRTELSELAVEIYLNDFIKEKSKKKKNAIKSQLMQNIKMERNKNKNLQNF